jgi:hypothetical protein
MSIVLDVGVAGCVAVAVSAGEVVGVAVDPPQALTNNENTASIKRVDFLSISTS